MSRTASPPTPHPSLQNLLSGLQHASLPSDDIFLVGGGVRDLLLGRSLKDLDLACRDAQTVALGLSKALNACFVPLGRNHDPPSFRVVPRDADQTGTQPGSVFLDVTEIHGRNILEDLGRRDFTVNAMALPLGLLPNALASPMSEVPESTAWQRQLLDPHSGRLDAFQGLIRRTGPRSLVEDPLRILRGFRLRAQLGWTIEPATLDDMTRHAQALARISGERIRSELQLILECPGGGRLLAEMDRAGVLGVLFPELREMRGCGQNHFHHLDVFEHSLAAVGQCEALLAELSAVFGELEEPILAALHGWRLPWLKLAVLLHDIGKPGTKGRRSTKESTERITFYGHDALGATMAESIASRLRLSSAESKYVIGLIREHLHVGVLLRPEAKLKARLRWMRRLGPDLIPAILLCLADVRATLGPGSSLQEHQAQEARGVALIREYLEQTRTTFNVAPLINGHDLLAQGLSPGPLLGRTLRHLQEAQDAGEITTREEAVILAKRLLELEAMTDSHGL
ncbi:CCA tRNA nucleotidyltransferase [Desulfonatronum thiodismutans]|uniref:CCA tRNA nucleotidyltransferase n=1 Tax=Desulfonatronum thiodismutans TaxID=159290 RepID=UPI000A01F485|nr:HD domain-containing protein [Desulfonatronum thiodismutans]